MGISREDLKPFILDFEKVVEKYGSDYISDIYVAEDSDYEYTGHYAVYVEVDTTDKDIEIVNGLEYDEVDYACEIFKDEFDRIEKSNSIKRI